MKLTARNRSTFFLIVGLSGIVGTLGWELLQRLLAAAGLPIAIEVGPVGIDLYAISFHMIVNPGTLGGFLIAYFLIRRI